MISKYILYPREEVKSKLLYNLLQKYPNARPCGENATWEDCFIERKSRMELWYSRKMDGCNEKWDMTSSLTVFDFNTGEIEIV